MTQVSNELILELQTIIKEDYSKELSTAEVAKIASGLVGYFDLLGKMYYQQQETNRSQELEISTP